MTEKDASAKRLALAYQMLDVSRSDVWRDKVVPYLEGERDMMMEIMASMTDPLQLMRYAGSLQTFRSLLSLEERSLEVIEREAATKLGRFNKGA